MQDAIKLSKAEAMKFVKVPGDLHIKEKKTEGFK
jgi:hypothetical protein